MMPAESADELRHALERRAVSGTGDAGSRGILKLVDSYAIAQELCLSRRDVELAALRARIVPVRYRRNLGTIGWDGQIRLLSSLVAVVGCGGLGGWLAEGLARMGVGSIVLIDGDCFEEDNLNRQLGCLESVLGQSKARVLSDRLLDVNGAVQVVVHHAFLDADNAAHLLAGADVVVDALDSLSSRYVLQDAAQEMAIPMVHGAVGGYTGQVMTILPGDVGLKRLYGEEPAVERGVETRLGNPAATPMLVASWQLAEVTKILVGDEPALRHRMLMVDTFHGDVRHVSWEMGAS